MKRIIFAVILPLLLAMGATLHRMYNESHPDKPVAEVKK